MTFALPRGPRRIVCLSDEPTEILYSLGEQERIVGISAHTVRPAHAKAEKPAVAAFAGGSVDKICELTPDLVLGFSDVQAELARKLIARHLPVLIFNQRSIQQILEVIVDIGCLVRARRRADRLVGGYVRSLENMRAEAATRSSRPSVYFEEWHDPLVCGIHWVSELIEIAGGRDVFGDVARAEGAHQRVVAPEDVLERNPDVMLASWCGKPVDWSQVRERPGFASVNAIADGRLFEIPSSEILQPGPAALTDGVRRMAEILKDQPLRRAALSAR